MPDNPRVNGVRFRTHWPLQRRRLQTAGLYLWRTSPLDLVLAALTGPLIGGALIWGIWLLAVPLTGLLGTWCAVRVFLAIVRGLWLAWVAWPWPVLSVLNPLSAGCA